MGSKKPWGRSGKPQLLTFIETQCNTLGDTEFKKEGTMGAVQKSLRLPEATVREIERFSRERGEDFSTTVKDLLEEALKMRRCPGIVFAPGISGRRARVAGTGIEVWEIIAQYEHLDRDEKHLSETFHWLTPGQIKGALGYYAVYGDEIDELIARNEAWTEGSLKARHPALCPRT
jgi:uncharacterized protein (DUF433 family)